MLGPLGYEIEATRLRSSWGESDNFRRFAGDQLDPDADEARHSREEKRAEERIGLNRQRLATVLSTLKELGARRVLDLGCGEDRLLRLVIDDLSFEEIVSVDVSQRLLQIASRRLQLDGLSFNQQGCIRLFQSSLIYRDRRLAGYDVGGSLNARNVSARS